MAVPLRIRIPIVACTLGLGLVAGLAALPVQDPKEKQIVVTVLDTRTSRPVAGLTAAGLSIKEDGQDRAIVKVEPAAAPMSVVLLADTTTSFTRYVRELRAATQAFLMPFMTARADANVALWEFGGAVVQLESFTTDSAKLSEAAGKLRPRDVVSGVSSEASSNLLTSVFDASRALGKRADTRRVIVSFNAATAAEAGKLTMQQIQNELQNNGVTWFAVTLNDGGTGSPMRDSAMTQALPYSGGLRITVADVTRLEAAMQAIAGLLAGQYAVTYKRPSGSPKQLLVETKGEGQRAFAQKYAPK